MAKNNNNKKTQREEEFQQYRNKVQDQFRTNFEFFLKVKDLKEDYETAKRELYREESIRFSNENEITYIDDLR